MNCYSRYRTPPARAMPSRIAPITRAALIACVATATLTGCGEREASRADDARADAATPVAAMTLSERDLSRRVRVSAPIKARRTIRLASRSEGTLMAVHVEEGDAVSAGEVLAELDMSEQRAELRRAEAVAERARLDHERLQRLVERDSVSQADYQRARAELRIAESERELWQTRVDFGSVAAPIDAVVTQRLVEPGEAVDARDTLFELAVLDQLVIEPGLSELDVVELEPGRKLPVRLDAMPDRTLQGRLERIFPAADPQSRLVTVEVALPANAAARGVRPGYLARVEFEVNRQGNVLALPAEIVGSDDQRGGRYVYVIDDGQLAHRTVETGLSQDGWIEITAGVEPGETVLASNPIDMRDGQRVRIVQRRDDS